MLSNEELAEIRERAERANPGPWYVGYGGVIYQKGIPDETGSCDDPKVADMSCNQPNNRRFIAASRTDIPRLLDEVEWLKAANAKLRQDSVRMQRLEMFCGMLKATLDLLEEETP